MQFSSDFWAAICGAVVGGVISAGLQYFQSRSARDLRQSEDLSKARSKARSIALKVIKIESDFIQFRSHSEECKRRAVEKKLSFGWASYIPLASFPRPISFQEDEIDVLARCKNDALFNDVLALDEVHSGLIDLLMMYRNKRMALTEILPAEMIGSVGSISLTSEAYKAVAPRMAELDFFVQDIVTLIEKETTEPLSLSSRLVGALNQEFGGSMSLSLKSAMPSSTAKSDAPST